MGQVGCCRKPDREEERNLERTQLYSSLKKQKNYKNSNLLILSELQTNTKYISPINENSDRERLNNTKFNNENMNKENINHNIKYNNDDNINVNNNVNEIDEEAHIKDEKIKKIQQKYRSYHLKNKFNTELKPIISKKTNNFIEQFYQKCSQGGETSPDDDFDPEKWKEFYPSDERFFLYQKGNTFPKQIRIKNADDPDNLEIYEGETNIDNLKHGFGTLTTPHFILKGSWRKDEFTGWGRKSMRNGDVFEGKFVNGELNGKGIFKSKDHNVYVGDFEHSKRNGKGELTTDNFHYVGEFKNDELNGNGIIDFSNEGHRYEGQFENNKINGKGIYKYKNGDVYEGEMKNGEMDGYGKFTYADGRIYEGEYKNGIKQGRGKLVYPTNKMYEGIFKDGVPDGEGFYTQDGHTSKVVFSNGEFMKLIA